MAKDALGIGINDYPGAGNDLHGCVNDARDRGATLKARGFTGQEPNLVGLSAIKRWRVFEEAAAQRGNGKQRR